MKFVVVVLSAAQADADAIHAWLAERSLQGATNWREAYRNALTGLCQDALQHVFADERRRVNRDLRQKQFKTHRGRIYRLIYLIVENEVRILRVRGPGQSSLDADDLCE